MTKRRGATFVEVLTAAAIFSLAIIVLFSTFSLALRYTQYAKNTTIAANVAQEIIEKLRLDGFDNVPLDNAPAAVAVPSLPSGFSKTYVEYFEGNDKIKEVTVNVYWAQRAEANAVTLTTLIGQGGISG
jgi:type II secretory pathway pseudopilin PulG